MIKVFVGCSVGDDLESQAVLEFSLRKHSSAPIEIVWMQQSGDPASPFYGWQTRAWSTPFSGFRFLVPALCNYEGRALYTDSDVIFRADIVQLWRQRFAPGKCVIAKGGRDAWRLCVSLWDCAAAKPHMMTPEGLKRSGSHQEMIRRFANRLTQPFVGNWNCVDGEGYKSLDDPEIKALHYSQESTQPHLRYAIPRLAREGRKHWFDGTVEKHWRPDLVALFDRTLKEAVAAGFKPENYAPAQPFGPYRIASHKKYTGHRWAS